MSKQHGKACGIMKLKNYFWLMLAMFAMITSNAAS